MTKTAPSAKETKEDVAAYREAANLASLESIKLIFSEFNLKPEAVSGYGSDWSQGYSCVTDQVHFDGAHNTVFCFISAEAFCRVKRKRILSLKSKYIVTYKIQGAPQEEAVHRFAAHVGKFAAYPYFRTHFAEHVSQAGVFLPPLPIMKEGKRVIGKSSEEPVSIP